MGHPIPEETAPKAGGAVLQLCHNCMNGTVCLVLVDLYIDI